MDGRTRAEYEKKSLDLKAQLKQWESEWARTHGRKKPGREDIKADFDIAEKYKRYQACRDILSGKLPPPSKQSPKKQRLDRPSLRTPLKRSNLFETPSKTRILEDEFAATPSISRKLFSPSDVTSLGPTPQRDGHVLGLFDLLVEREIGTPSRERIGSRSEVRGDMGALTVTPRKRPASPDDETRLSRTPMSASKRRALNTFMTPLKKKDGNSGGKTPISVSKLQFETPQFLKRHTALPTLQETETGANSMGVSSLRLPRKPLGRGLSEIVASLRQVEDNAHDDDEEALREAEGGDAVETLPRPNTAPSDILAPDSQRMLGGFDDEGMYDSPVEDANRDGSSLRVFKKKGQKRTTRKSTAKPVWTKRPEPLNGHASSDDEAIPETQHDGTINGEVLDGEANDSGSDFEDDSSTTSMKKKKTEKKTEKKESTVKKAAKKVNSLAHANFKRLKLRNHGAKGGPGQGSRFRRRR